MNKADSKENNQKIILDKMLRLEIMRSEKKRVTILGVLALLPVIFITLAMMLFGDRVSTHYPSFTSLYIFNGMLLLFAFREFGIRRALTKRIETNNPFSEWIRYINLYIEVSIPSILLFILAYFWESVLVLSTPIIFLYIIYIFLTTLSLERKLCLFAGTISAIEYGLVLIYVLSKYTYPEELSILNEWYIHTGKVLLVFASGVISGFVANQLRTKIYNTFELFNERGRIINLFNQQVSQQIVDELITQTVELESKRKFVCVMFLDIRGFTSFAEEREPEEIIDYQNKVFGFMIDAILKHHGIINQFLGDGYMATFGAPLSKGNDAMNAVDAAMEIVKEVNRKSIAGEIPATRIGIGLHAGNVIAGNVGTEARKQYSISGNTVILASRIEQLNKKFKSQVLISGEVLDQIDGKYEVKESFGEVEIKGRANPMSIYKLA